MIFKVSSLALVLLAAPSLAQDEQCSTTWKCTPTDTAPLLDANHDEWADVEPYTTTLVMTSGTEYIPGEATYKCLYDAERIYFAMEIPGNYRFSTEDNHFCAAIGTMFKIGEKATYLNMGGCPDAFAGCPDGVPETCDDYRVDIGAHWELRGTEMNTYYGVSDNVAAVSDRQAEGNATDAPNPPGNDLIANKDDEYAVSSYCRFDDDDANAGNEWAGAWAHTNPVEGEDGVYHFEMSRLLQTASTATDAQLSAGDTIQFGIAFWDPYETEETGWTDIGHYVTGCGTRWIDLELATGDSGAAESTPDASAPDAESTSGAFSMAVESLALLSFLAGLVM